LRPSTSTLRRLLRKGPRRYWYQRSKQEQVRYADHWLEPADVRGLPTVEGFSPEHLLLWKDAVPRVTVPRLMPANRLKLAGDELVLGAERDQEARVYPTATLRRAHLVNDRLAGRPFLVTFCPRCQSGMGFDPVVSGQALTFVVFGSYQGAMVMQDEQTGTIWAHITGEALVGPLVGQRLEAVPLEVTTLQAWMSRHPHSMTPVSRKMALVKPVQRKRMQEWQRRSVSHWDDRLAPDTRVLGVTVDRHPKAYVVDPHVAGPRLSQDEVGGVSIALLAWPGAWPRAFERRTPHGILDLHLENDRVVDQFGSTWNGNGRAHDGALAGVALTPLPSILTEWFAWAGYHPDTEIGHLWGDRRGGQDRPQG